MDAGLAPLALSGHEVRRLFQVARGLRDEGRALVFISHRLDKVFDLCDAVTVLRDGEYVATAAVADTTVTEVVTHMVGRTVDADATVLLGDPYRFTKDNIDDFDF